MQKTATIDKNQATTVVQTFFQQFQNAWKQSTLTKAADFEQCLTHNFKIESNGHIVANSTVDYVNRLEKLKKKYSKVTISKFLEEPICSGNKCCVHYTATLTNAQNQQPVEVTFIAIATFEGNKISHWTQVSHEKGGSRWDA